MRFSLLSFFGSNETAKKQYFNEFFATAFLLALYYSRNLVLQLANSFPLAVVRPSIMRCRSEFVVDWIDAEGHGMMEVIELAGVEIVVVLDWWEIGGRREI
jgi:hypothetical protein